MHFPKTIVGKVVHGDQIGRTIGFPTANLDVELDPAEIEPGVYLGRCKVVGTDHEYDCLPYFGPRTVVGELHNIFEVYIYHFNQQIYGQTLEVELLQFTRPPAPPEQVKSLDELKALLEADKAAGSKLLQEKREIPG